MLALTLRSILPLIPRPRRKYFKKKIISPVAHVKNNPYICAT